MNIGQPFWEARGFGTTVRDGGKKSMCVRQVPNKHDFIRLSIPVGLTVQSVCFSQLWVLLHVCHGVS